MDDYDAGLFQESSAEDYALAGGGSHSHLCVIFPSVIPSGAEGPRIFFFAASL